MTKLKRKWFLKRGTGYISICYDTEPKDYHTNEVAVVYGGRGKNAGRTMVRSGDHLRSRVWFDDIPYSTGGTRAAQEIMELLKRGAEIIWSN